MIGSVFDHPQWGGEGNNNQVEVIKSNQGTRLIKPDQIIELINLNQGMGLIKPNKYIQS